MILIADSGSSKTDFRLIDNEQVTQFSSKGLNPDFQTSVSVKEEVQSVFTQELASQIKEVHFYGSGCSSKSRNKIIEDGLAPVFSAAEIIVEHDLLGAARAACGNQAGIAGILGTGSNCCSFDGENISKEYRTGGFIIGDEGGGVDIGKAVLKAFIEDYMPKELREKFDLRYQLTVDQLLENFYKKATPNRFIASFSRFAFHHREHPFMARLVHNSFDRYFQNQVLRHVTDQDLSLNLVGSIAFYFQEFIRKVGQERGIRVGTILEKPISGLTLYHQSISD